MTSVAYDIIFLPDFVCNLPVMRQFACLSVRTLPTVPAALFQAIDETCVGILAVAVAASANEATDFAIFVELTSMPRTQHVHIAADSFPREAPTPEDYNSGGKLR